MIANATNRFTRLTLLSVAGGFGLLVLAFLTMVYGVRLNERNDAMVEHTYDVSASLQDMILMIERAENARRGYILRPDPTRAQTVHQSMARVLPLLDRVERLTRDNPAQQRRLDQLRPLVLAELGNLSASMAMAERGDLAGAHLKFTYVLSSMTMTKLRNQVAAIQSEEQRQLSIRKERENATQDRIQWVIGATGLLLMLMVLATALVLRRYVVDLERSRMDLSALNERLEERVAERTIELKRVNDEIQRFAYIVSHDLRSPLVNIMGFTAELDGIDKILLKHLESVEKVDPARVPDAVRFAVREDLPEALQFIRSSTAKMDRLINAILTLSREGQRRITPEPVALDELADGIAQSLEQVARDRGATIRVETPLPAIVTDRLALEQILSNLVENATKYGYPGRPGEVVVRGKAEGSRVLIEIADNGRGVAPGDQERIFELFRRAGRQDQAGEGIGLANVRALAYRLGGTVTISSVLNEGSVFLVNLPARLDDAGGEEE